MNSHERLSARSVEEGKIGDTVRLVREPANRLESRFNDLKRALGKTCTEDRIAKKLELLSETFGLASRRMALVAVIERESDQPGKLPETRVVPVGMPQDVSFDSYFGPPKMMACFDLAGSVLRERLASGAEFNSILFEASAPTLNWKRGPVWKETDHPLLELASEIESDGVCRARTSKSESCRAFWLAVPKGVQQQDWNIPTARSAAHLIPGVGLG